MIDSTYGHSDSSHALSDEDKTSPEAVTTPATSLEGEPSTLQAETNNFGQLDDYVAVGCILEPFASPELASDFTNWNDTVSVSALLSDKRLAANLETLALANWIRLGSKYSPENVIFIRVHVLSSDRRNCSVDRQSRKLQHALSEVLPHLKVDETIWRGEAPSPSQSAHLFDRWATPLDRSLFYCFNKVPSPSPSPATISDRYARDALVDLLDPAGHPDLRTILYPYQGRAAGAMLQREIVTTVDLDPRYESRMGPDGRTFFYNAWDVAFNKERPLLENSRSGILAESMGLGKTLIALALIVSTRNFPPRIPPHLESIPIRSQTASLADMAAAKIGRDSFAWRTEVERIQHFTGETMERSVQIIEKNAPCYEIPFEPARQVRRMTIQPARKVLLSCTTLIVVPRNLLNQWTSEITKHIEPGILKVLIMDNNKILPSSKELTSYNVIIFSRPRFEKECSDGSDQFGRQLVDVNKNCRCPYIGSTRLRDCTCPVLEDLYDSPLKHVHFKRLIIDEGHFSSNEKSRAVTVADKLIIADHRWIISGTPAKDLLGAEVDLSSAQNAAGDGHSRDSLLQQRRHFTSEDVAGPIRNIGAFAVFLKMEPWTGIDGSRPAIWQDYIYRHVGFKKRSYTAFASSFQRTVNHMMIKTQMEDVERDIVLPPLEHKVVRLTPSLYDKLTANLFATVLKVNAVTSERTDADYLFHKNSVSARHRLIANLRQSAFFWSGFTQADVESTISVSSKYLEKCFQGTSNCSEEDKTSLREILTFAESIVLNSSCWKSMSEHHEIGVHVAGWAPSASSWSFFDTPSGEIVTGLSQLITARRYVEEAIVKNLDPMEGFAKAGLEASQIHADISNPGARATKVGVPSSSVTGEPRLKKKRKVSDVSAGDRPISNTSISNPTKRVESPSTSGVPLSSSESVDAPPILLREARVVGTASAKLSYLLSEVEKHATEEKIIIFYTGDNAAYYIAQALEIIHVEYEIYARGLAAKLKSKYVVQFNENSKLRVLLMDVSQAAFGLNICCASRIYFVNPVCRPMVEAQAVKRAHRIGQTRRVHVETLVLSGSLEEKMMERAELMTRAEHRDAKVLDDDGGMKEIIQNAWLLPITEDETKGLEGIARLEKPLPVWQLSEKTSAHEKYDTFVHSSSHKPSEDRSQRKKVKM